MAETCWLDKCEDEGHKLISIQATSDDYKPRWFWQLRLCRPHWRILEESANERGGYSQAKPPGKAFHNGWWPWQLVKDD